MKNLITTTLLIFGLATLLFSQDYDAQWIQSPGPTAVMDFRNDTIAFHHLSDTIGAFEATANICDKNGNFLFFTNGIYVFDRNGNNMPGGNWLSFYNPNYYLAITFGAPNSQGVMILPKPGNDQIYYIFHFVPTDTNFTYQGMSYSEPTHFYYSLVDMSMNFGLGDVFAKDIRLPLNGVNCASKMTAVKHANGRDWWIIRHGWKDNKYIKFLLTPDEVLGPYFQNIGPAFQQNGITFDYYGTSVFNQQGTQMASVNAWSPTVVLDFDRCSGEFSNPLVIRNSLSDTTILGGYGLSFSPSGRFLYVNTKILLNQYDLWSATPNDSVEIYKVDSTDGYYLNSQRLAPNGKIYISTYHGGSHHLHVINQPDSFGVACGFQFQGQECMTSNTANLPNMVNYKLGALAGSGCDTIITGIRPEIQNIRQIQVYPNPTGSKIKITVTGRQKSGVVTVYNTLGEVMGEALVNGFVELDISAFPNGVYQLTFTTLAGEKYNTRLVKSK
jgi:hypothetical protein